MRLVVDDGRLVRYQDLTHTFSMNQQKFIEHAEKCPGCAFILQAFNKGELQSYEVIAAANLVHAPGLMRRA